MATIATTPDLREGHAWTRAQAMKNALLYAVARAAIAIVSPLPAWLLRAMGRALGRLAYVLVPSARRTAHENLARAMPDASARERAAIARKAYVSLGGWLGETVASLVAPNRVPPLAIDPESARVLESARAEAPGVLFASAHLGPWERVAASLVAHGVPLTTIARESYDPRFTRLYDRLREGHGVRSIYRGSPGAAARILRVLGRTRGGGVLGVPMDLRSRVPSIDAPFLGQPAPTPVGPARLALRTGAAVVVGTCAKDDRGGLVVRITRIRTDDLSPGGAGERRLTERINAELSSRILAMPEGWLWMHDRFR